MRFPALITCILCVFSTSLKGQDPNWGSIIALDNAQIIVEARLQVDDAYEGWGRLLVTRVIRGDSSLQKIKVRFSDRHPREGNHKHEDPPRYDYADGAEGIWLLGKLTAEGWCELRRPNIFVKAEYKPWVESALILLRDRPWSTDSTFRLSGSVLIDSMGGNDRYRFFYFCLRNDSDIPLWINTHCRIREEDQRRQEAWVVSPAGERFDFFSADPGPCRLSGEPGWPSPLPADFKFLRPGEKLYLQASGSLRCYFADPSPGKYEFHGAYKNDFNRMRVDMGRIWTGRLEFPLVEFGW